MLTAGDEFGRTQSGNNNAYAQDNLVTWLDWSNPDEDLLAFSRDLTAFRRNHPCLTRNRFLSGGSAGGSLPDVVWLRADGAAMTLADWESPEARSLGMALFDAPTADRVVVWINGAATPVTVRSPAAAAGRHWRAALTSASGVELDGTQATLPPRSVTCLEERPIAPGPRS